MLVTWEREEEENDATTRKEDERKESARRLSDLQTILDAALRNSVKVLTFKVSSQTCSAFSLVVATFFVDKIPVPVKLLTTNLPVCSTTSWTLSFEVIQRLLNLGVRP